MAHDWTFTLKVREARACSGVLANQRPPRSDSQSANQRIPQHVSAAREAAEEKDWGPTRFEPRIWFRIRSFTAQSFGNMKVYFCGSIRGGRDDVELYGKIITELKKYGTVLTEHVSDQKLDATGLTCTRTRTQTCTRTHAQWQSVFSGTSAAGPASVPLLVNCGFLRSMYMMWFSCCWNKNYSVSSQNVSVSYFSKRKWSCSCSALLHQAKALWTTEGSTTGTWAGCSSLMVASLPVWPLCGPCPVSDLWPLCCSGGRRGDAAVPGGGLRAGPSRRPEEEDAVSVPPGIRTP